jgi:flagellar M-ring protein FliF
VAVLVFFGMVRPGLRAFAVAFPPPPPPRLEAVADELPPLPVPALPAPRLNEHLDHVRKMARDNPAAVAGIIRTWSGAEATPTPTKG